jgi:hypothetical protein
LPLRHTRPAKQEHGYSKFFILSLSQSAMPPLANVTLSGGESNGLSKDL